MDMNVSLQSISNVINNIGTKRKLMSEGEEVSHFKRYRSVRTEENIKAVKKYICKKNPKTHSFIQNKLNMSTSTINKIIHKDLDLETEKKTKVQVLNSPQKRNRKTNSRKLYEEEWAGDKCEYVIIIHLNIRSLINKLDELKYYISAFKPMTTFLSETWLNRLIINRSKSKFMIIGSKSDKTLTNTYGIERTKELKILGVIIDNKLIFSTHIEMISKLISKKLGLIRRIRHLLTPLTLQLLYKDLIQPHFTY
jgi:hypothetical protein